MRTVFPFIKKGCSVIQCVWFLQGFPGDSVKNLSGIQETQVQSLAGEDPWIRKWQPTPVFLPGGFHGQRSLVSYTVHGVANSQTRLSD